MGKFLFSFLVLFCLHNAAAETPAIKIGWIIPLTGATADYGESTKNGVQMATAEDSQLFTGVQNIFEDAQNDPRMGLAAFQKLRAQDQVQVIVVWGVAHCQALAPLADQYKIPMIGLCVSADSARNRKYYMLGMNTYDDFMKKQVEYLQKQSYKKLALIQGDHSYIDSYAKSLRANLPADIKIVKADNFPLSEQDFRTAITVYKNADLDAVGVFLYAGQIAAFFKQAAELNLRIPVFGTNIFETLSEIKAANGRMDSSVYPFIHVSPEWVKRYADKYKKSSQLSFAAVSYEAARILAYVLADKPKDGLEIIEKIKSLPQQKGLAAGPYQYVNSPDNVSYLKYPVIMKRVQGMGYVEITENN